MTHFITPNVVTLILRIKGWKIFSSSCCLLGKDMQKQLSTANSLKSFVDDNPPLLRSMGHKVCVNLTM
jgi:hypothetical protein